jgi:hypothetical protein
VKMKTITTIAASMMLMATTASAAINPTTVVGTPATTHWVGTEDTSVLPNMCQFTQNTNGVMKLDTDKQTWKTDATGGSAAVVKISFRNVSRIKVEADDTTSIAGQVQVPQPSPTGNGVIYETPAVNFTTGAFDADVTYKGSTIRIIPDVTNSSINSSVNDDEETFQWTSAETITTGTPDYTAGVATFTIAGKATPTGTAIYDANAQYRVPHKVTCLQ